MLSRGEWKYNSLKLYNGRVKRSSSWFFNCNECCTRPIDKLHAIIGAWLTVGRALANNCIVPEKNVVYVLGERLLRSRVFIQIRVRAKAREKKKEEYDEPIVCNVVVTVQSASNVSVAFISYYSFYLRFYQYSYLKQEFSICFKEEGYRKHWGRNRRYI